MALYINKIGWFLLLLFGILFGYVHECSAVPKNVSWFDEPVTIRFQDEKLSSVLGKIAKQTDIAILYDIELANEKVSGNYKDIKASDAITRLFSDKNKSIQISKDKKVIVVKTFGAKNFIWAGTAHGVQGREQESRLITVGELEKMHSLQYKKYKERIANDNEIIEGGENPMTRGEIRALHEKEYQAYKERIANDNEIIEGGENPMTRGEIRALHEKGYQEYKERIANDNEIIEGSENPMTRGEIRALHEKEYQAYRERIANDNEIIEGGEKPMTRGQIRAMHEQQYKEYKDRQNDKTRIIE